MNQPLSISSIAAELLRMKTGESIQELPEWVPFLAMQFTDDPSSEPEIRQDIETLEDAFENFQPSIEAEFTDADGAPITQKLSYRSLGDFTKAGLINGSEFLKSQFDQKEEYETYLRKMKSHRIFQTLMNDPEGKEVFIELLDAFIQDLEKVGEQ